MLAVAAVVAVLLLDTLFTGYLPFALKQCVKARYLGAAGPGRPTRKQHIAVITRYADNDAITRPNFQSYCKRHGYDLIVLDDHSGELELPVFGGIPFGAISKILRAPAFLDYKLYDWVLWADSETVFLNHQVPLERIIDTRYAFIVPAALPEQAEPVPSTSHFLVSNSQDGQHILQDLHTLANQHCGQFIVDHPGAGTALNGWLHVCNADGTFWNGASGLLLAVLAFTAPDYRCRFKRVGHRIMDSQFPAYNDGDLAISLPHYTVLHKRRLLTLLMERADCKRGRVDRTNTNGQLDPVDPGLGDWRSLEALYDAHFNVPCVDLA